MDLHTRLWRVFCSKEDGIGNVLTIGVDDRFLEVIKCHNCLSNYRFGSIPVNREKSRKDIPKDTSGGKHTEVPKRIAEAIEAGRAGPVGDG